MAAGFSGSGPATSVENCCRRRDGHGDAERFPAKGWRLRIWYNETIDEEIEPQRGDCIELSSGRTLCCPSCRSGKRFSAAAPHKKALSATNLVRPDNVESILASPQKNPYEVK